MATIGDTVLFLTRETPESPSSLVPAVWTAAREDGDVLLLQGAFFLGYDIGTQYSPESPEPMQPGQWTEMSE